jgi:pyruvate dehydrogenase E1 component
LDWLLCDALRRITAAEDGASAYFRLTTRPLDQAPFEAARQRIGDDALRRQVLAGGYRLVDGSDLAASGAPTVHLVGSGAVLPEVLAAADDLRQEGVAVNVVDVTSLDRLYTGWQQEIRASVRQARGRFGPSILRSLFTPRAPIVTVHDAASHTMAWLGSALGVPAVPLGVDSFGQSGSVAELYRLHDLVPGAIVNAALAALGL